MRVSVNASGMGRSSHHQAAARPSLPLSRRAVQAGDPLAGWWVLDYKSATQPERQPQLIAQLQRYRAAVQAQVPGEVVGAAFLSGEGRLVRVPEGDDAPAPAVQPLAAPVQGTLF